MQNDPRSRRNTTSYYPRQPSPIRTDRIKDDRPANSKPSVATSNCVIAKASATSVPLNRQADNVQHKSINSPKITNSPLMQSAQTQDPRLQDRVVDPVPGPPNCTKLMVAHSQSTVLDGPASIMNLIEPIRQRISYDYQKMYEIHQRNFMEHQQDNERRHVDAEKRYDGLQEKFVNVEKLRSEEKGRWEAEKKDLVKRLDHCKASYTGQLEDWKNRTVQLECDKGLLAQQLKQSFIDGNTVVGKLEEEKMEWEIERKILTANLEACKQDAATNAEQLEQERSSHAETVRKYNKETQQLKHEKTILTTRLKEERFARDEMITAMRISGRDKQDTAKFNDEDRERKRMRLG